jgi:hypothetical protein
MNIPIIWPILIFNNNNQNQTGLFPLETALSLLNSQEVF